VFGWAVAVLPLAPQGKLPLIRKEDGGRGYLDATTDLEEIRAWWSGTPDANIGLSLAPNGLCAVDLDGAEGLATWAGLRAEYPGPLTCATQTGSGGGHLIYRVPEGRRPRGTPAVFPSVDLRGPGYIVAPGSTHPNGNQYTWVMPPWRLPPQPAPEWILLSETPPQPPIAPRFAETDGHSRYGRAALIGTRDRPGLLDEVAGAPGGTRNATLYRVARRVLDLVERRDLEYRNAWDALMLAAHDCGLPEREILATLESVLRGHRGA